MPTPSPSPVRPEGPTGPLTPHALHRFEQTLKATGAPVVFGLPATAAQLDTVEAALGRPVPDDLKTLYRWHNGAAEIVPQGRFVATNEAVDTRASIARDAAETWHEAPELQSMVPLVEVHGTLLLVSCAERDAGVVYGWSFADIAPLPRYASTAHWLRVVERAYQSGAYYADHDQWLGDPFRLRSVEDEFQPLRAAARRRAALAEQATLLRPAAERMERLSAVQALTYEAAAVPVLIGLLHDQDRDIVMRAAFALGAMHAREAIPHLLEMLDRDPRVAADALADILSPDDDRQVPRFLPLLNTSTCSIASAH